MCDIYDYVLVHVVSVPVINVQNTVLQLQNLILLLQLEYVKNVLMKYLTLPEKLLLKVKQRPLKNKLKVHHM